MNARLPSSSTPRRSAFTLVEVLVSLTLYGVIFGIIGAAVMLMSRAKLRDDGTWRKSLDSDTAEMHIVLDLRQAMSFSKRLEHDVEFTVADRNGDGIEDKIRYWWSGSPGDPLNYHFNELVQTLVEDVHVFDLQYQAITPALAPLGEELALLKFHDDSPGGHFHDHKIEANKWAGQYVYPSFADGADPTVWKIKRLRLMAKSEGDPTEVLEVRITTADQQLKPTTTILDVVSIPETALEKTYTWVDIDFTSLNDLDPTQGVCIVIAQPPGDGSAGKIPYNHAGDPMTAGTFWTKSDNAGSSWSDAVEDKDMRFFMYGTYDNYNPTPRSYVGAIHVGLQLGEGSAARIDTAVRVLNVPEIREP